MGSAYSALAKDAYAPVYNPAGLGFLQHPELAAQHLSYLEGIDDEFASYVMPLGKGALGGSIQYLGSGDIAGTGTSGESIGDFSVHYAAYSLAYGRKLTDRLALGLTGKMIDAKIADTSARAYAADLGALLQATDRLAVSATADNIGTPLTFTSQGDTLPMAFHAGAAYQSEYRLKSTVEGIYNKSGLVSGRAGVEWSPVQMVAIRAGYKTDTVKGLSALAGLTTGIGLRVFGQEFAYAWLPYGDLGDTQYFSMLIKFGAQEEERRNLIQYQHIKRHRTVKGLGSQNLPAGRQDSELGTSPNDPDYQQLMQLLSDDENHVAEMNAGKELRWMPPLDDAPDRDTLAPMVGSDRAVPVGHP